MVPSPSDADACPVCGEPYEQRIVVSRGDQWSDLYPGTPFSFFRKFRRRCAARQDVETEEMLTDDQRAVYFHGKQHGY
jgi:hypothetical protein